MSVQTIQLHNIPSQPTHFIGREPEITEIVGVLQDDRCRLLTLVGPGGIGKTRLSIESIQRLTTDDFEHGIFYIPLAPLTSADNIVTTVIGVLGILIGDDATPQEGLVKFLSQRKLLLVMDNFEHVLDRADLVADILHVAPNVKVLATSREALNLSMEYVWHVSGMRYPDVEEPEDINQYDALNLFIERALQIRRDFSPGNEQLAIIQICQLVDGLPLGIELAVSWLKTLSCRDIIDQIEQGIDILSTRTRNIPQRHRSIRAVFDHSWKLLTADEQNIFPKLSVFRGGFKLEAAIYVADADLLTLAGLVEKSMVRHDASGRYDIHELLRQYAQEKLDTLDEVNIYIEHHMHYFATFMADRAPDIKGRRQVDSLNEIAGDFDNIVEAWRQGIHRANSDVLNDMMETLSLFVDIRALTVIGERLFREAMVNLSSSDLNPLVYNRLQARYIQVWILQEKRPIPDYIIQMSHEYLQIAENHSDEITVLLCVWLQGELHRIDHNAEQSLSSYEKARELSIKLQSKYYEGRILRGIEWLFSIDWIDDPQYYTEVSRLHREVTSQISDINGLAYALYYIGVKNWNTGKLDAAQKDLDLARTNWQTVKNSKRTNVIILDLGLISFRKGNFEEAESQIIKSLQLHAEMNFIANHAIMYSALSSINIVKGDYKRARELFAQALDSHASGHIPDSHINSNHAFFAIVTHDYKFVRENLYKVFARNESQRIISTSFVLVSFVLHHDRQYVRATETLGFALKQMGGSTQWVLNWDLLIQLRADLESELGSEIYQTAWERGSQLDIGETISEMLAYLSDDDTLDSTPLKSQPLIEPLTKRELDVLTLLAEGLTNSKIAQKLHISTGTVRVHTRNIYGKLSASNRTEAANIARNKGII